MNQKKKKTQERKLIEETIK